VHEAVLGLTKLWRCRCGRSSADVARNRAAVLGTLLCLALTSCAVGPDYVAPAPPIPGHFAATTSSLQASIDHSADHAPATTQWWRLLHDSELDTLVERAVAASPTLEIALDRLQQARAQEIVVVGMALPSAEWTAGGGWGTGSDLGRGRASQSLVSAETGTGVGQVVNLVGFDASWELDIFGKYRRAIEAAQYDTDAALAARNVVLVSLIADVVRAYLDLRALQMELVVLRKNIEVARKYLDLVQERYSRGITNELDVTLAQRELAQLQAQVAPLTARIDSARYVIAVLIGEFPENLGNGLKTARVLPVLPVRIRAGLPIDLLRRRPDIVEAERQLASATAQIGVATATLFPQVAITASAGQQTGVSPFLISPIWSIGPAFAVPLLDFGRLDAAVEKADYRGRELLFAYKQTVLNAVREVDTAIDAYAAQQNRLRHLAEALTAARRALTLATERFERGLTDSLNVIDAQRQEYAIEEQYVLAQQRAAEEFVFLHKSLGGGWESYQVFPPIRRPLPAAAAAVRSLIEQGGPP
jgi:NodT family efflux transporter outer membrane factor (OMF) lipoprotein